MKTNTSKKFFAFSLFIGWTYTNLDMNLGIKTVPLIGRKPPNSKHATLNGILVSREIKVPFKRMYPARSKQHEFINLVSFFP